MIYIFFYLFYLFIYLFSFFPVGRGTLLLTTKHSITSKSRRPVFFAAGSLGNQTSADFNNNISHACSIWTNQMHSKIFSTAKNLRYAKPEVMQSISFMSFTMCQHHVFHKQSIFSCFHFYFASVWYYINASVNEFGFWSSSREHLVEGKCRGSIILLQVHLK